MKKTILTLSLCFMTLCGYAQSQSPEELYNKAVELSSNPKLGGDPLKYLKEAADADFGPAQLDMGIHYEYNAESSEDIQNAIKYLTLAAEKGYVNASTHLGLVYYNFEEVRDYDKAVEYLTYAAENGDAMGQLNLARIYNFGVAVEVNPEESFKWAKKATDAGYIEAFDFVMNCYLAGYGVDVDYQKAVEYATIGADNGNIEACRVLGELYLGENDVLSADYPRAVHYTTIAAEAGDVVAMHNLSVIYLNGLGVDVDEEMTFKLVKMAAEGGHPNAMYNLGACYKKGIGTEVDEAEAERWFALAAEAGFIAE